MEHGVTTLLNSVPGCLIVLSLVCKCHYKGCRSGFKSFSERFAYVGHIRRIAIIVEPTRPKPETSEEEVGFLVREVADQEPMTVVIEDAKTDNMKGTENGEKRAEVKEVSPPRYSNLIL